MRTTTTLVVSALLLLAGAAGTAHAEGWETPIVISDGSPEWLNPRVATRSGPGNDVNVVWRDDAGTKVMHRRSTDGGRTWFPIQTLYTGGVGIGPHIASAGNTVHVVWRGPDQVIKYLRSTSRGGVWDPVVDLSTPGTVGYSPDVAAHQDRVYVAWIKSAGTDVVFTESLDNGAAWSVPDFITGDGGTTDEAYVRVAAWGSNAYFVWLANQNVIFRRKTGAIWDFPQPLWTGDSAHVSIAAYETHVFVDRNQDVLGPAQRVSTTSGAMGTFAAPISLGLGGDKPEVSAHREHAANGGSAYLDTRDSVHRIFFSDGPGGETQIDTITGSTRNTDVSVMRNGSIHVVANSSAEPHVQYQRYVGPRGFRFRWRPPLGVARGDAQWGDFDGDGDLDLAISGEQDPSSLIDVKRVTQTYENVDGTLTLHQDLEGVSSESSGNLAWGDYDLDGDLDLLVAGMADGGRIARVYENNGLGTLTWDTAQSLTDVSNAAAAWGDFDNDGDLDLVVTGHSGAAMSSILYENDPPGTLTAGAEALVGLHGGCADWADWDADGDLDLLLTGYDGSNRRVVFYENDPVGTLADTGTKGLIGVNLSDAAWGDHDGDGDLDLICTGNTDGGSNTFAVYANDGAGNLSHVHEAAAIYRSSGAWGDYDNEGHLDYGLCGYTGVTLTTRIDRNTDPGFTSAFSLPGVRDGAITWADADQDGNLDFFFTGWDFVPTPYADLYENYGGEVNEAPSPPTAMACDKASGRMELTWSGATDAETTTAGLYYLLRVGTTAGANDIVSGTYATPLMGNVGQATALILEVPADTYYWSVAAVDSGLMASDWAEEQVCGFCPADFDDSGAVGFQDLLQLLSVWGPCAGCDEDLDNDDVVGFQDLLLVLASWGPCP